MAINPGAIAEGVTAGLLVEKAKKPVLSSVDEVAGIPPAKTQEDYLHEIHLVLVETLAFLKNSSAVTQDVFKFQTLYKSGFGPPYIPMHRSGRVHFRVLTGPAILLNVVAPGIGAFNLTTQAAPNWNVIDFPDGTQYYLDASNTVNQLLIWEHETDADVI